MSNEQLMTAYLDGRLGRRQLVRRLVAGGVSLTAAMAYAGITSTAAQAAPTSPNRGIEQACLKAGDQLRAHTELCGA